MTPAQQAALEALAGRQISAGEVAAIDEHLTVGNVGAVAALLSVGRVRLGTVSVGDLASWAAGTGMRAVIEDHASNSQSPLRSIALSLRDVLSGAVDGIRLDLSANVQMLGAWVSAGELSPENRDALLALASTADTLTPGHVSDALEGL